MRIKRITLTLLTGFFTGLLMLTTGTGCSVVRKLPCDEPKPCKPCVEEPAAPICTDVEKDLLFAATSIEKSLNTLAAAQEAVSPPIINIGPLVAPEGGMSIKVDIDWTGPIQPLIKKIAQITDYRVKVLGNEPAIPIIVTITSRDTVIAEVLQNASFQAGARAHILAFPENRVIELRYLPS